jgi:outer membrane scaffolding protein for murein synthesis (MipA/OmpV family)
MARSRPRFRSIALWLPVAGVTTPAFAADEGDAAAPAPLTGSIAETGEDHYRVRPAAQTPAEQPPPPPGTARASSDVPRDIFTIGAGVGTVPSYTGSDRNIVIPAVVIRGRISGYSFTSRGVNLSVDLIRQKRGQEIDFKFGPAINIRNERSASIKDVQVAALGKRDRTLEAGAFVGVAKSGVFTSRHDQISLRVSLLKDVLGKHGSTVMTTSVEYGTPLSKTAYLGLQAQVSRVGKGYGRTYYDVDAAGSAASGLPVYTAAGAKSGFTKYAVSLAGAKAFSGDLRKGWSLVGGVQYGRMLGRYARSPIVSQAGDRNQLLGGAGIAYSF